MSVIGSIYKWKLAFSLLVLCLASGSVNAQFYNLPNEYFYDLTTQRQLAVVDTEQVHPGIQPYIPFFSKKYEFVGDTHRVFKFITDDPLLDKIFFDHLIHIKSKQGKYEFKVDPLLNMENGRSYTDTVKGYQRVSTNTRGFIASGSIGKDFYFYFKNS